MGTEPGCSALSIEGILFSSRTAVRVLSLKHISESRFPSLALELMNHNKNRLEHWVSAGDGGENGTRRLPSSPAYGSFSHFTHVLSSYIRFEKCVTEGNEILHM